MLGFPCPDCESPGPHHVAGEDYKGDYLVGYILHCHSCEWVWYVKC